MALSDVLVGNITSLYLGVIATIKILGLISGRSYSGVFVLLVSTTVVLAMLVVTLSWDVSRKAATYASSSSIGDDHLLHPHLHHGGSGAGGAGVGSGLLPGHKCRGGICWHGTVAVGSTVSQVRFRLPHHHPVPIPVPHAPP